MKKSNAADKLVQQYKKLLENIGYDKAANEENLYACIRKKLKNFMEKHGRVALYCYGMHTHMLMADFISELRNIICVVDNEKNSNEKGIRVIRDAEIENNNIDGIIISSFKYRKEVKDNLQKFHATVDILDLYQELEKVGIYLNSEFYCKGPYQVYTNINEINNRLTKNENENCVELCRSLLTEYLSIKDFRMAASVAKEIYMSSSNVKDRDILSEIESLYKLQQEALANSSENNVLMLCLDGMRRCDFYGESFAKTYSILKRRARVFSNAYSYSTMTFESLVPAFSENSDQQTKYFLEDSVSSENCRFVSKALQQNRDIAIYGDGCEYISDRNIKYSGSAQTITEKLWDFIIDASSTNNGLFYLHELYESHFSFPNPYTKGKMVANGTALLFDFLPKNGGSLQTDYSKQLKDSLLYLDETIAPFIEKLPGSLVVFADHGNLVLDPHDKLENIKPIQLIAAEEWIRIPLVIVSPENGVGVDDRYISLMDINEIMISVLENRKYDSVPKSYIKIGRSRIYNADFKELYAMVGGEYTGEAFEGFIFEDGYKLIVYSDGRKELFHINEDKQIKDSWLIMKKYIDICGELTVLTSKKV